MSARPLMGAARNQRARNKRERPMNLKGAVLAGLLLLLGATHPEAAQTTSRAPKPPSPTTQKADPNAWTVGLAGGLLEGTFIRYAADIAKVLDDGDRLRVIPMVT